MDKANTKQIGGTHYKVAIQPWDYITTNNLGYLEGTAIKYLSRWRNKNGIEDLRKAIHFIEKLIEVELANASTAPVERGTVSAALLDKLVNESIATRRCVTYPQTAEFGCTPVVNTELNDLVILRPDSA